MHLSRTDIVPLVRLCWDLSFENVNYILKAIAEWGWGAYNRMLLLHPFICASMTETMIDEEKISALFSHINNCHIYIQLITKILELGM